MSTAILVEAHNWITSSNDVQRLMKAALDGLGITAKGMTMTAMAIRRLEEIGEHEAIRDAGFTSQQLAMLRKIADGRLLPEVVLNFDSFIRKRLQSLPVDVQKRLIDGERITVMLPGGDSMKRSISELMPLQAKQVFGDGFIRNDAEQIAFLAEQSQREAVVKPVPSDAMIDRKRRLLVVTGPKEFTERELIGFIAELAK
jgi:hypothetical protein